MFLGKKIKDARIEKGLTQKQLAEKLMKMGKKASNTAIANWESGLNSPDIETLQTLCIILGKDGNYFFESYDKQFSINNLEQLSSITENTYGVKSTKMLNYYQKLNDIGKEKAVENIKDLTEVPKYVEKKTNIQEAWKYNICKFLNKTNWRNDYE